ncbi:hypothetical protein DC894_RS23360 [Vibrio parahaemolyticus]|nr:hypothetical protein [Vibrio parahaemolyticus]EJG0186494.1 hypothetical protein [Vibrio parahaemolyticus]EJG0191554.1 hypothetical protein [Vibrio parahaemolyticus]
MDREIYILISVFLVAVAAYITARVTSTSQQRIAQINAEKDLRIHESTISDERIKLEIALRREKLEELHSILSKIALENSQTVSFIQSDEKLELSEFRKRYLSNCELIHKAEAIAAIYYPEMTGRIEKIYGCSNLFWGYQEGVLRTDINEKREIWHTNLEKVIEAGREISSNANSIKQDIENKGSALNKAFKSDS